MRKQRKHKKIKEGQRMVMEDELLNEAETDAAMRDADEENYDEEEEFHDENDQDQDQDQEQDNDIEDDEDEDEDNDNDNDEDLENDDDDEEEDEENDDEENEGGEDGEEDENENENDGNENEHIETDHDVENTSRNEDREVSENAADDGPEPIATDSSNEPDESSNTDTREKLILKAQTAKNLDIIPSVAVPYATQCHVIALNYGPKWLFTGGEDGFIRKYDFVASIEGKSPLTMAQKHSLVDSITKAGVISSFWENEQPLSRKELSKKIGKKADDENALYEPKVSPVHALAVDRNAVWLLSGLGSGGVTLQTIRHHEGSIQHYFKNHTNNISVLKLNNDETRFLSGSWDKQITEWDLNTGSIVQNYTGSSGQISSIQYRPMGSKDIIVDSSSDVDGDISMAGKEDDLDSLFGGSDDDADEYEDSKMTQLEAQDSTPMDPVKEMSDDNITSISTSDNIFMSSCIDGSINIWDNRTSAPVIRYGVPNGTPPWSMSSVWSNDGENIYIGRRNSTIEEFSLKMPLKNNSPNVSKALKFPLVSGQVSVVQTMPNSDFLLCGSHDNIRLYDLKLYDNIKKNQTPFLIIPGHHGGVLSSLYVDPTGRFMVSASGNRGWQGQSTESVLIYEIDF